MVLNEEGKWEEVKVEEGWVSDDMGFYFNFNLLIVGERLKGKRDGMNSYWYPNSNKSLDWLSCYVITTLFFSSLVNCNTLSTYYNSTVPTAFQ